MYLYDDPGFSFPWYWSMVFHSAWYFSMESTHSHFRVFLSFLGEWGYVAINAHVPCIYGGRNNDGLDQFGWNLIVKFKMRE